MCLQRFHPKELPVLSKKQNEEVLKPLELPEAQDEVDFLDWRSELGCFYETCEDEAVEETTSPQIHKITLHNFQDDRPHVNIKIFDVEVTALLDCGSNLTFINQSLFDKFRRIQVKEPEDPVQLQTADGSQLQILGEVLMPFTFNGKTRVLSTLVAPELTKECICGMDSGESLGSIPLLLLSPLFHPNQLLRPNLK